jgi:hypothetical protein
MTAYAYITMVAGFMGVLTWAAWTAGYAAGKLDTMERELSPLDSAMTAEDAARRNGL